jgi:hypothetical protein
LGDMDSKIPATLVEVEGVLQTGGGGVSCIKTQINFRIANIIHDLYGHG